MVVAQNEEALLIEVKMRGETIAVGIETAGEFVDQFVQAKDNPAFASSSFALVTW